MYTLDRVDGTHAVERFDLTSGGVAEMASFDAPVREILDTADMPLAFTIGASCAERSVVTQVGANAGSPLQRLEAGASGPVSVVA